MNRPLQIAVIGAGIAGVSCARSLAGAGHRVVVYDKSRGVGGRMATRHAGWTDDEGRPGFSAYDHGAPSFGALTPGFQALCAAAEDEGWLCRWSPPDPDGQAGTRPPSWVGLPDMPELCRRLLGGLSLQARLAIDAVHKPSAVWQLESQGRLVGEGYDRLIIAVPPSQAAPLLAPHRADWAALAAAQTLQPCWTLMGSADRVAGDPLYLRPPPGQADRQGGRPNPLQTIIQNSAKPCRDSTGLLVHWVAHARPDWSQDHLEDGAAAVQAALQQALEESLGHALHWRHALVHRWRFAQAQTQQARISGLCWQDGALGLGVCGDFFADLPGQAGVENAWLSAQSLADTLCGAVRSAEFEFPSIPDDALTPQAIS